MDPFSAHKMENGDIYARGTQVSTLNAFYMNKNFVKKRKTVVGHQEKEATFVTANPVCFLG